MSTTIKRVALVAVAALGLGVVSVAPSQAAHIGDTLTLTPVTSSISTGDSATATVNSAFLGVAAGDSITVNALIASKPSTGAANLQFVVVDSYTATQHSATASAIGTTASISTGVTASSTAANTNYRLALINPTVAGTYVVQVYASVGSGSGTIHSSVLSWSVTVAAVDTKADATSVSRLVKGNIDPTAYLADTTITTDSSTVVSKAATGIQAVIKVTQKSAVTTAVPAEDMLVTISGPGTISSNSSFGSLTQSGSRALTVASTDFVAVYADGTTGVSTITFTGAKSGVVLAKKTVTFFDTKPAKVEATVKKAYILAGTDTVLKVLAVKVTDANGNPVTTATITAAATDTATTVGGAATCLTYDATDKVYYCGIAGKSATKFGKVNYTITAADAEATPNKVTTTADVTFSSAIAAKITIAPAATTANPGDVVTYTYTATDANGYPVADQDYNTAAGTYSIFDSVVSSGFSTAPFAKGDTITTVSGVATSKGTLNIAGTAKITWTLKGSLTAPADSTSIAKAIAGTDVAAADVTISNPGVDAATDAANEAAQAASDATDAALAAADAADAATTKAQEAVDAVATLSAEVSKLITALKAQITTLTNLVIKIQKKVKA